jgi:MFS family permease
VTPGMTQATQSIPLPHSHPSRRSSWRHSSSALAVPNFRLFAAANVLGMTATWAQRVAQDWLVLQLTGSVAAVGLTVAMQFGPMLLLGLYGGVIVDRYPKRVLLMLTQGCVGVLSLVLSVLVLTGTVQVWEVWAMALIVGLVTIVDNPARQVFASELVGPERLRNAVTINSAIFQLGGLIGPAVSGALLVAVGGGPAFGLNALACFLTVAALARLDRSALHPMPAAPRERGQLREGLTYVKAKPTILWPIVLVGFLAVFALTMPVLLAAYANDVYHVGAGGYGLFTSLVAIGAFTGALLSTRRQVLRLRTVVISGGVWAAVQALAAFMPSELTFGLVLVASGIANQFFFMAANPLIQMTSSIRLRGRVMAVWILVLLGGQGIGGPVMGAIVDAVGPQVGMLLSGLVPAVAAVGISIVLARKGALRLKMDRVLPLPSVRIASR